MTYQLFVGNNLEILPTLPDNSVDSIVTDPPYGLSDNKFVADTIARWIGGERDFVPDGKGFMGKAWDAFVPPPALWDECLRILKPGGHLLAFFGSRTQDIGALAIRLAGFEIRDSIAWLYGSGFPKSMDISKAIDKAAGAEREVVGVKQEYLSKRKAEIEREQNGGVSNLTRSNLERGGDFYKTQAAAGYNNTLAGAYETAPSTPEAQQWQGWGTALKPALEPIVVARKPIEGTVAANVLKWGTGGLNIDGSRIGISEGSKSGFRTGVYSAKNESNSSWEVKEDGSAYVKEQHPQGRWPANIILDPYTAELLDEQSGQVRSNHNKTNNNSGFGNSYVGGSLTRPVSGPMYSDSGGASRFFKIAVSEKPDTMNLCENTTANNVANHLTTIRATIGNTALTSVDTELEKKLAQTVKDAGILCDSCGISIAQSLVELKTLASSGSTPLQDFMHTYKSSTLIQNLASIVEQWVSTDTIPTTTSLSKLFGSVPPATAEHIRPESLKLDSDQVPFLYQAKASKRDRNEGLDDLADKLKLTQMRSANGTGDKNFEGGFTDSIQKNFHPTVKPTALMEYLVKLVTPPNGTVLDPFTGSGSTGKAAIIQGFNFIGIEMTEEYVPIIEGRLKHAEAKVAEAKENIETQPQGLF